MKRYFSLFVMVALLVMSIGCQMPGSITADTSLQGQINTALADGKGVTVADFSNFFAPASRSTASLSGDPTFAKNNVDVVDVYMFQTTAGSTPMHVILTPTNPTAIIATNVAGTYKIMVLAGKTLNNYYWLLEAGDGTPVTIIPGQRSNDITVNMKTTTIFADVRLSGTSIFTSGTQTSTVYSADNVQLYFGGDYGSSSIQMTSCNIWAGIGTVTDTNISMYPSKSGSTWIAHGNVPTPAMTTQTATWTIMPVFNGLEIVMDPKVADYLLTQWMLPCKIPYNSVGAYWASYVTDAVTLTLPNGQVGITPGTVTVGSNPL